MARQKGSGKSKATRQNTPPAEAPPVSLNEIAAEMVLVELSDLPALVQVHDKLSHIAASPLLTGETHTLILQAVQKLRDAVLADTQETATLFAEASRFMEMAVNVQEGSAEAEPSSSPTPPAAGGAGALAGPAVIAEPPAGPASPEDRSPSLDYLPADYDADLTSCFVTESRENLEGAEAALLALETNPDNLEAVNTVFRAFHTLKGTSGFLGLTRITELAHHAESLLCRIRDREIRCTGGYADLALRSADMLSALVQSVQNAMGGEPMARPDGYDELVADLGNPEAAGISENFTDSGSTHLRLGDILVAQKISTREEVEALAAFQGQGKIGEAFIKSQSATVADVAKGLRIQQKLAGPDHASEATLRVRTERLDRLIEMVGELVISQSMISQDPTVLHATHHELAKKVAHSGKIVRELQDLSMLMRMVPLKATFQKMNRLVRDLAQKCSRQVEFTSQGEDTEIDRNMVDVIGDPLVHMIRNSVDHGIESPDIRERMGKPRIGTVVLSASHAGGNVVIKLQDDGKGLDREKIIQKAVSKGLLESDKGLSDHEVFNLIFAPGFSTADQITDVSGRGVGMDVVRRSVEALRGHIDIASEAGKGATFTIRLPLTLAITDGMLVRVGPERYIIPTVNIRLSFQPTADALSTLASRGEMVMLRGDLMPIFRLHRLFQVAGATEDPRRALLVVVGDGTRRCCLLVDELLGQQQVVAKTLGDGIGKIQGVSGGAILGDGRVGLILDTAEIVAMARQTPASPESFAPAASGKNLRPENSSTTGAALPFAASQTESLTAPQVI